MHFDIQRAGPRGAPPLKLRDAARKRKERQSPRKPGFIVAMKRHGRDSKGAKTSCRQISLDFLRFESTNRDPMLSIGAIVQGSWRHGRCFSDGCRSRSGEKASWTLLKPINLANIGEGFRDFREQSQ